MFGAHSLRSSLWVSALLLASVACDGSSGGGDAGNPPASDAGSSGGCGEEAGIRGCIVDSGGAPAADAQVRLESVETPWSDEVPVGADGCYEVVPLPAGLYRVAAESGGASAEQTVEVERGCAEEVDLTLAP
jgi:hypothetical protein